jgi:hydroxymethylpyrimidine/phosphomethylpyrimidine kinase
LAQGDQEPTQSAKLIPQALANAGGWLLHVVTAGNEGELDAAIAKLIQLKAAAFLFPADALFSNQLEIVAVAARHRIPTIYTQREQVEAGVEHPVRIGLVRDCLKLAEDTRRDALKRGVEQEIFKSDRQRSNSTHGTGCAFATAVTCHLAQGRGLPEAVLLAKAYVSAAIVHAQPMGRGIGPVHHLYRMYQQRRTIIADQEPVNLNR